MRLCTVFLTIGVISGFGTIPALAQPVNDECVGATPVSLGVNPISSLTATESPEPGPTLPCIVFGDNGSDVWYEFTAVNSVVHGFSTCDLAGWDTDMMLYEGACGALVEIACNGDGPFSPSCQAFYSTFSAPLVGGVTYLIRIGSWSIFDEGTGTLSIFEQAPEICGDGVDNDLDGLTDCADSIDCSLDPTCDESLNCADGIDNDADFLTDCADTLDCGGQPACDESLNCADAIDNDADGLFDCDDGDCFASPACASPSSDFCLGAVPIGEGSFAFDTTTATPGGPFSCGIDAPDVWFEYTSSCNGQATIQTTFFTSANDTVVHVFDACAGTLLACNDDFGGSFLSFLQFPTTSGTTYLVRMSGWAGATGTGNFDVSCVNAAPEVCNDAIDNDLDGLADCDDSGDCSGDPACLANNDYCIGAVPIGEGSFAFDTTLATTGGPFSCGIQAPDVWFAYTSTCNGQATIAATSFSSFDDTVCHVYDACAGNLIACNDDFTSLLSFLQFPTTSGTTYLVRMSGWAGATGTGSFDVSCFNAGPEICTDGNDNDLDGLTDCADAVDCGAEVQCNESLNCADAIDNDLDGLIDCADSIDCPTGVAPCIPPGNDDCLTATPIACGASVVGDTVLANPDVAPFCGTDDGFGGGVWFSYAGNGDQVTVSTCNPLTNYDTKIRVYQGDCTTPLCVTGLDDSFGCAFSGLFTTVSFLTVPGVDYFILVHGFSSAEGNFDLTVTCITPGPEDCTDLVDNDLDGFLDCLDPDCAANPLCIEVCNDGIDNDTDGAIDCVDGDCACTAGCPAPVPGDECCAAIPITSGATAFSTVGMTTSSDVYDASQCPSAFGNNENDIWFSWVAPGSGNASFDTCDASGFDTDVTIYEGPDCLTKVQVACNGDDQTLFLPGCQIFYSGGIFPVTAGTTYLIRVGAFGFFSGSGTLNIAVNCAAPVTNLVGISDCLTGDVSLSWDPAPFSGYDIQRNGTVVASLPAGAVNYTDLGVPNGNYAYDVVGLCSGGGSSFASVSVSVAAYGGEQDLVVRGERPSGLVDSVAALTTELTALGRSFVVWDGGIGDYGCNTAPFEIIWNMNGTNVDPLGAGYRLTVADGAALYAQHLAGAGVYVESSDQWGYAPVFSDFDQIDGVSGAADGNDGFTAMDGSDSGLGLDVDDLDNVGYTLDLPPFTGNFIDQLIVAPADTGLSAAAAIWSLDDSLGTPYVTGVYGIGLAGGNVISQSWEFGGFGGNRNDLAVRYIAALGGGAGQPEFKRGDTNNDNGVNIADAVYLLGALFPPPGGMANVLACRKSGDGNDDGGINIADAVAILASLFGSPAVPLPAPNGACGVDPTTDSLDCLGYSHCP